MVRHRVYSNVKSIAIKVSLSLQYWYKNLKKKWLSSGVYSCQFVSKMSFQIGVQMHKCVYLFFFLGGGGGGGAF